MSDERRGSPDSDAAGVEGASYVNEIMAKEAEKAAEPPPSAPKRKVSVTPALIVLTVVLAALTGWNISRLGERGEAFSDREIEAAVYLSMLIAIDDIEAHRDSAGGLPVSLEPIGAADLAIVYRVEGDTYILIGAPGMPQVTYRSGDDTAPLGTALDSLMQEVER